MALATIVAGNNAQAADINQFKNLLTGVMTDQAVTFMNQLSLAPGVAGASPIASSWGSVPVKLAETNPTGGPIASVSWTGIPGTFKHLMIMYQTTTDQVAGKYLNMTFNNDGAANYNWIDWEALFSGAGSPTSVGGGIAANYMRCGAAQTIATTGTIFIPNYSNGNVAQPRHHFNSVSYGDDNGLVVVRNHGGDWNAGGAAITRVDLFPDSGSLKSYAEFSMYGFP